MVERYKCWCELVVTYWEKIRGAFAKAIRSFVFTDGPVGSQASTLPMRLEDRNSVFKDDYILNGWCPGSQERCC